MTSAAPILMVTTRLAPDELARLVGHRDPGLREKIRSVVFELLGRGEALP